jgi:hypothetical protein
MNEMTENFSVTTAEDQNNYFSGDVQIKTRGELGASIKLNSGTYRVIDRNLYQIISGLSPEEVRERLTENAKLENG